MTLASRVLGLVREVLMAALFGAGAAMDAFFVAFRIPNLFRRLFAEGAFAQAFVPVFSEAKTAQTPEGGAPSHRRQRDRIRSGNFTGPTVQ